MADFFTQPKGRLLRINRKNPRTQDLGSLLVYDEFGFTDLGTGQRSYSTNATYPCVSSSTPGGVGRITPGTSSQASADTQDAVMSAVPYSGVVTLMAYGYHTVNTGAESGVMLAINSADGQFYITGGVNNGTAV